MAFLRSVLWLSVIIPVLGIAQEEQDTTYFRTFPEKITVRAALLNTSNDVRVTDRETADRFLLKPNTKEYLGLSVLFRSVELDLGYSPKFLRDNKDNGDSKLFTMNFRMFLGKWMQTIDFYSQKSFTLSLNDTEVILPNVRSLKIGGGTSYIFNENFSFRAIGFQNEWQQRSAGSFIPRFTFYYSEFDFDIDSVQEFIHTYDIAVGPGYYYNLVIGRNFIISAGGNVGAGVNFSSDNTESATTFLFEANARSAVGYNSERFFAGVNANYIVLERNESSVSRVDDEIVFLEFYLGFRFDAPKKLLKWADDFNEKFGL
jgi:hypothetical protein